MVSLQNGTVGHDNRRACQRPLALVTVTVVPAGTFGAWASTFPMGIELHWLRPPPALDGVLDLVGVSVLWTLLLGVYAWLSGWVVFFLLMAFFTSSLIDQWEDAGALVLDDLFDLMVIAGLWLVGPTQVGLTAAVLVAGLGRGWLWSLAITWTVLIALAMLAVHARPDGN